MPGKSFSDTKIATLIPIDVERPCHLNAGALYRFGKLGYSMDALDKAFKSGKLGFDMLASLVFCGLPRDDRKHFGDPEAMADAIKDFPAFCEQAGKAIGDGLGESKPRPESGTSSGPEPGGSESAAKSSTALASTT